HQQISRVTPREWNGAGVQECETRRQYFPVHQRLERLCHEKRIGTKNPVEQKMQKALTVERQGFLLVPVRRQARHSPIDQAVTILTYLRLNSPLTSNFTKPSALANRVWSLPRPTFTPG